MAVGDDKPGEEAEGPSDKMELMTPKKMTRFQVNKVDLSMSNPEELNKLWDDNVEDTTTNYAKSFRHFTREALPRLDNYRNIMSIQAVYRPTLDDLHEDNSVLPPCKTTSVPINDSLEDKESHKEQLGWFRGVYIKNLLHLWGIIFYLRLSWTLGQAGILEGMLIILSSSGLAFITALSVSAISSNGLAQGGGAYVMISRSLGPEFGASIGLIFSFANSMLTSMFIIGISELLVTSFSLELVDGGVQDIRILGVLIICVLLGCALSGVTLGYKVSIHSLFLGGAYVMISRSLGPEFGASIGLIFSFANSMLTSMFIIGISELLVTSFSLELVDGGVQDIRILGVLIICVLLGCALSGVTLGYKVRVVVFFVLAVSILNILLGSILSSIPYYTSSTSTNITSSTKEERGLKGFSLDVLQGNLFSSYSPGYNFFTVLGVYFPAIIGFLNGANSSKELKDPCCDIPKGTLYALLTGTASYVLVGLTSAAVMIRTVTPSTPYASSAAAGTPNVADMNSTSYALLPKYGLREYFEKLESNLNDLAPLISTPFLAAYALVNFSVFHASLIQPIGWRPTFKLYNMWLSLSGAILCMVVMFLICWITALFTLILILAMYLIIVYRKPDVNWGSTTQAQTYRSALEAVQSLNHVEEHVKNYQPQILVLCGLPSARPALVDFANLISKNISLLVCGHITKVKVPEVLRKSLYDKARHYLSVHKIKAFYTHVDEDEFDVGAKALLQVKVPEVLRKSLYDKARHYLSVHKIKAFYTHVDEDEFDVGAKALLQCTGLGKLRPNTLMMGYKTDWTHSKHELQKYFNVIHMVLDNYKAMCILR
ncbi:bumetanide-sensitive sodium-(potassium)-chloride cotransporter-like [Diaphorina citri]|uniref:Bumetanide-sensitive sodium-(Potassium)-chloride cotransporter-like n=1 Tax=Diaphorina citri TaxID=121845 RepID=A0A3Q0IU02_DIACI|nr:bumetanide-sensitive sodium-(potassium)-chloride cotransporter-like [Diaphorina citri]